ncbi:MAG: PH domain-containing protein, partial [Planctomycetota bacterium]
RIPVNRIQDLSFEQSLVRRFVGLVVVTVETASGEGGEARLDSLGLRSAGQLRVALQHCREQIARGAEPGSPEALAAMPKAPTPGEVLFKAGPGELLLRGLSDNRFAALFVAIAGLYEMADQFGMIGSVGSWIGNLLQGLGATLVVLLVLALIFVALLVGWVVSVVASFLLFHDFTLIRREGIFQRKYGLFTTRTRSLPQRKIQRVLLEQNWVRRLLQMAVVRADSAGSGAHEKQEAKGGLDVVAPLARLSMGRWLSAHLLPGLDVAGVPWRRVSPKVVQRLLLQGATAAMIGGAATVWFLGPWVMLFVSLPLITWGMGALMYRNLGYARLQDHFCLRWGILGRYRAMIPLKKVQAVTVRAGPEDRVFGLAKLSVYVAGCGPTTLDHLTRADADHLRRDLAHAAAESKFVW